MPIRLSVGFAHGVMNTDNMSVASVTIDYGPFGFVDEYNPNFIPNTSDDTGRYDLESQASVPFIQYQSKFGHVQFPMRSSVTVTTFMGTASSSFTSNGDI